MLKYVLVFLAGAAAGGLITWLAVKEYYYEDAEERIQSYREVYKRMLKGDKEDENNNPEVKTPEHYDRSIEVEKDADGFPIPTLRRDGPSNEHVDYSKYIMNSDYPSEPAGAEIIEKKGRTATEEEKIRQEVDELEEAVKKNPDMRYPKLIDEKSFMNEYTFHDKITLLYYTGNNILATENDEVVYDQNRRVGDYLTRFNDPNVKRIFVRTIADGADYDVQKVSGYFEGEYDPDEGGER